MAEAATTTASVSALATPRNADTVAWCPYEARTHLLACGCYELDDSEKPPRRHGHLALLAVSPGGDGLKELSSVADTGVLDCAWLPQTSADMPALLAAATSDCDARLYALAGDAEQHNFSLGEACATMPCADAGDACMALEWGPDNAGVPRRLALCSTTGQIYVGELSGAAGAASGLRLLTSWQAHDLEGWAVAFAPGDASTLYTGADDAQLKRWDLRCALDDGAEPVATASNRRSHRAGVCCISPSPAREHLIATGSYDETARLWDARQLKAPLSEAECGGGVWRLKWHPVRQELLLAACMHAGFAVLRAPMEGGDANDGAATGELAVVARYEEHGMGAALGYGADWSHAPSLNAHDAVLAATCSFYDRALHVWKYSERDEAPD